MSVRSVFPPRAVFQSATPPADRTSRRSSSVVRARACVRACERGAMRLRVRACWHGGTAQCAASRKEKRSAEKRMGTPNKEKAQRACPEATADGGRGV